MIKPIFLLSLIFISSFIPANAQEESPPEFTAEDIEDAGLGLKEGIAGIFDQIGSFGMAQTNSSDWFDQDKKDQINEVTDSATGTGKIAFDLWFSFHELIVDAVFAGSPVPFDRGFIILISFVVGAILVTLLFKTFFMKIWKVALAIIIFIAIIMILGIEAPAI